MDICFNYERENNKQMFFIKMQVESDDQQQFNSLDNMNLLQTNIIISVIIPIYNVEKYLRRCLDSLVKQTFEKSEFILIDDGSTDNSKEIIDVYAKEDSRFRVFHTGNHGLSTARNLGVDIAKGEYIMFVDSDDYVAPQFCELPYKTAIATNADLVIFGFIEERPKK